MINLELYKGSLKGKKQIYQSFKWIENENGFETFEKIEKELIKEKLKYNGLKISVEGNKYIKIPKGALKFLTTGSGDDNYFNGELSIYNNRPNEVYVDLESGLVNMEKIGTLRKPVLISVIDEDKETVENYYISINLEYKDNGQIKNDDFNIDVSAYINKINTKNYISLTIIIAFYALLVFLALVFKCYGGNGLLIFLSNNFFSIMAIVIAYLAKTTFNLFYSNYFRGKKGWLSMRGIIKMLEESSKKNN